MRVIVVPLDSLMQTLCTVMPKPLILCKIGRGTTRLAPEKGNIRTVSSAGGLDLRNIRFSRTTGKMLKTLVQNDLDLHSYSVLGGRSLPTYILLGCIAICIVYTAFSSEKAFSGFPQVPIERKGYGRFLPSYIFWIKDGQSLLSRGLQQFTGCFQVPTGSGYKIIVPNKFAEELRNHPDLNFNEAFARDFFVDYPGFDGHRQGLKDETFLQEVVRVKLTQSLGLITDDLVEETTDSLNVTFGKNPEWNRRFLRKDLLDVVARLSSRVFLGKELCRNKEWLEITKDYTVDSFMAANLLKLCPNIIRPVVYWFIPTCARLRKEVRDARKLIMPEVERRRKRAEALMAAGEKPPKAADAIGWMVEVSRGREIDYVGAQLSLSMAAIHTTSETTINCVLELCDHPEIITMLREEMIEVLTKNGWSKVSLYKMKLLDSFLKEVQRKRSLSSSK